MSASGRASHPSGRWRLARRVGALLVAVTLGGCKPAAFDVLLSSGGSLQLSVTTDNAAWQQYERLEFCWQGELVTADPAAEDGVTTTAATYFVVPLPAAGSNMVSENSEDLRPGTWRLRYRLTGHRTGQPSVVLLDVGECVDYNGVPPQVTSGVRTVAVLVHSTPGQCNWYPTEDPPVPNMGEVTAVPCTGP